MITILVKNSPHTYTKFREWMLKKFYDGNRKKYDNFIKLSDTYKYPSLIAFLEQEYNVPIVEALFYYYKVRFKQRYIDQIKSMIVYEFTRIEQGKVTDYNIF